MTLKIAIALLAILLPPFGEVKMATNRLIATIINPGDTMAAVEKLLGAPYATEFTGPPGEFVICSSYPGVVITFNSKRIVVAVR